MPMPAFTPWSAPRRLIDDSAFADAVDLHDTAHAAELERALASTRAPHALMQSAGLAVARLARAMAPHARRVRVLAGPGNNGGDGFEAAASMTTDWSGVEVDLIWLGRHASQPGDAAASRLRAVAAGVALTSLEGLEPDHADRLTTCCDELAQADGDTLVIDALLGRGLNRPAAGDMARLIEALNAGAARVLSVDLPSGLNGDTGVWPDGVDAPIVQADATLALLSPSPGLCTGAGRDVVGELWWHDLGTGSDATHVVAPQARLARGSTLVRLLQPRPHRQHKGCVGDLWVVGGDVTMQGAAWLAARAALACGAGRVHVDLLDAQGLGLDPGQPELMVGRRAGRDELDRATVVAGCGGGTAMAARLPELLATAARLVLDADALNAIARDVTLQELLRERAARGQASVLTPHPLEAARLLDGSVADVQADRLAATRALAARYRCTAMLKGSGSIVCGAPAVALPTINTSGNAALATPGSGDVLAGAIGAFWSQLASGPFTAELPGDDAATLATRAAVDLHGRVAQSMSHRGAALPASHLASGLGDWLRRQVPPRSS